MQTKAFLHAFLAKGDYTGIKLFITPIEEPPIIDVVKTMHPNMSLNDENNENFEYSELSDFGESSYSWHGVYSCIGVVSCIYFNKKLLLRLIE
jgi:hypothetical protein